jgi:hypothetical protein
MLAAFGQAVHSAIATRTRPYPPVAVALCSLGIAPRYGARIFWRTHSTAIPEQSPGSRVSTLALFFDLVFVFAVTQVTDLTLHSHDALGIAKAFLVLTLIWRMYGGYAWLTNTVGTTQPLNRVRLLAAMAGFLVMALSVPQAFGSDGLALGSRTSSSSSFTPRFIHGLPAPFRVSRRSTSPLR